MNKKDMCLGVVKKRATLILDKKKEKSRRVGIF